MEEGFLLQPEILEEDQLYEILKDRGIEVELGTSKPKLLDVFHRLCVPLPQRQYKPSRRGKELLSAREKQEKEQEKQRQTTSSEAPSSSSSPSSSLSREVGLKQSLPDVVARNRIKPPPDVTESKKIKLSTSITHSGSSKVRNGGDNFLDKIIIKDKSAEKKVIKDKEEENTIKIETEEKIMKDETEEKIMKDETEEKIMKDETEEKIMKDETEEKTVKKVSSEPTSERKIKLKRPVIEKDEDQNSEALPEESKPKKVRQKISWP